VRPDLAHARPPGTSCGTEQNQEVAREFGLVAHRLTLGSLLGSLWAHSGLTLGSLSAQPHDPSGEPSSEPSASGEPSSEPGLTRRVCACFAVVEVVGSHENLKLGSTAGPTTGLTAGLTAGLTLG